MSGKFITFEGIDGCGKTTQLQLFSEFLTQKGVPHLQTREPGGTQLGDALRHLLLDAMYSPTSHAEVLMILAARSQHLEEKIFPALKQGLWVLSDRFSDATLAYQGYAGGMSLDNIEHMMLSARIFIKPNLTFLFDIDEASALDRCAGDKDRIESKGMLYMSKVRDGYLTIAREEVKRVKIVDAMQTIPEIQQQIQWYSHGLFTQTTVSA